MAETGIHVGSGGSKHKLRRVLVAVGVVLGIAVLVGGAVVGLRWWQQREEDRGGLSQPEAILELANDVQDRVLAGDYDGAHETIAEALQNPDLSDEAQFNLYMQQAATYESQQKYDEAMQSYRKAEALQENLGVVYSIANLAQTMGDKELAIAYFKKAIPLVPEDDPMREQRIMDFENWVKILESGEQLYE